MAGAPPPPQNDDRVPPAQERNIKLVYERDVLREIRVLETRIGRLELQLNNEMQKISSCSGLLEEIISQPQASPCSSLHKELDRARAKRERAYHKLQRQQLDLEIRRDGSGHGGTPNPPTTGGVTSAGGSN